MIVVVGGDNSGEDEDYGINHKHISFCGENGVATTESVGLTLVKSQRSVVGSGYPNYPSYKINAKIAGKPENCTERTTVVDDEKRVITHSVFEGDPMKFYKVFDLTLTVTPKVDGNGCLVKWTLEYEKINDDVPTPTEYIETLEQITKDLDACLQLQA